MSAFRIAPQPGYGIPSRTTRKRPTERSSQYALVDRLRRCALPDVLWFCIPNGEFRDLAKLSGERRASAFKLLSMGVRPGVLDLFFGKNGEGFFLELKREDGRLSPAQNEFMELAALAGFPCYVRYSFDEAIELLIEKGILPPDRRAI